MQVCAKISKATIKLILKIIYKISKLYCMWYQDNFSYQAIDLDDLSDQWNEVCPDCGSYDITVNKFPNGVEYFTCYNCGKNWLKK